MPLICFLVRNRCLACLVLLAGIALGIVGWATSAYSAMTGTTIFLVCLVSTWPARIALGQKEGGRFNVPVSHRLSLALLFVWALYIIGVQAAGGLGSMGYFIGLFFIWVAT
jgi:hypothetical protein